MDVRFRLLAVRGRRGNKIGIVKDRWCWLLARIGRMNPIKKQQLQTLLQLLREETGGMGWPVWQPFPFHWYWGLLTQWVDLTGGRDHHNHIIGESAVPNKVSGHGVCRASQLARRDLSSCCSTYSFVTSKFLMRALAKKPTEVVREVRVVSKDVEMVNETYLFNSHKIAHCLLVNLWMFLI